MEASVYKAFDLVAAYAKYSKGQVITNDPLVQGILVVGDNFPFVWMYTSGRDVLVNVATGEQIERVAGDDLIANPIPPGQWQSTAPEDFEVLCFSPFVNSEKLPLADRIEPVVVRAGNTRTMPHLTKFFLAKGSIIVDDRTIAGPKQVLFKTGDKVIIAATDAYGVIVR